MDGWWKPQRWAILLALHIEQANCTLCWGVTGRNPYEAVLYLLLTLDTDSTWKSPFCWALCHLYVNVNQAFPTPIMVSCITIFCRSLSPWQTTFGQMVSLFTGTDYTCRRPLGWMAWRTSHSVLSYPGRASLIGLKLILLVHTGEFGAK